MTRQTFKWRTAALTVQGSILNYVFVSTFTLSTTDGDTSFSISMAFADHRSSLFKPLLKPFSFIKSAFSDQSKQWLRVALITGTTIGAFVIGTTLIKYVIVTKRESKRLPVNGLKAAPVSSSSTNYEPGTSGRRRNDYDEECGEESSNVSVVDSLQNFPLPLVSRSRGGSVARSRRRSDSTASGTTTLLLCTRNPSELILYGLEALKRSIRLLEECKSKTREGSYVYDERRNAEEELEFIITKGKQLIDDIEDYRTGLTPERENEEVKFYIADDTQSIASSYEGTVNSSLTLPYYDIEPNIHFFKLYMKKLENLESIELPRVNRTNQLMCETDSEFIAKVDCLRDAFSLLLSIEENRKLFIDIGHDILSMLLSHSLRDPTECLQAYYDFIEFFAVIENHESLAAEVATRSISCLSFYDLVLDYIILDSFDDLENPPSAVLSVANNRWLSAGFRELALQTAVSAVLRHKRSKLSNSSGFFSHFYNILDHISPILAWGFLGTDYDLKFKCNLIKESLYELIRDYFSFDKVRYTSLQDLSDDLLKLTKDQYYELQLKLSL